MPPINLKIINVKLASDGAIPKDVSSKVKSTQ